MDPAACPEGGKPMGTKPQTMTADGEFCVYLGPTIVGVIQYGAIYMGSK